MTIDPNALTMGELRKLRSTLQTARTQPITAEESINAVEMMLAVLDLYEDARRQIMLADLFLRGINSAMMLMELAEKTLPPSPIADRRPSRPDISRGATTKSPHSWIDEMKRMAKEMDPAPKNDPGLDKEDFHD